MKIASVTSSASLWNVPEATMILGSNEVHVWRASLDDRALLRDNFLHTLAAEELERAKRFYFQRDRERFVAARGILRAILGLYLKKAPQYLSFCYSSYGKPALTGEAGANGIRFNLSHSHGMALYAITRGRELGIDLELIRHNLDAEQIAERFFSRREIETLRELPADQREHAFFLCWTRKEAYIKARGEGLSLPLDRFDVSLILGEPSALLSTRPDSNEALRWLMQDLTFADYAAALAVEGRNWSLFCWQWSAAASKP